MKKFDENMPLLLMKNTRNLMKQQTVLFVKDASSIWSEPFPQAGDTAITKTMSPGRQLVK